MEFSWSVIAILGAVVGSLIMIFVFRKREQKFTSFGDIDGVLKQDWMRTGNIDFHTAALESTSPQLLVLRVERKEDHRKRDGTGYRAIAVAPRNPGRGQRGCDLLECQPF